MAPAKSRSPLTRDRVLFAAVALADTSGIGALSMRKLGEALDVEAMSLYNHVPNKSALLDGMVDIVFGEIELPAPNVDWRNAMRRRASSARDVLARHRWAIGLVESRSNPGPATLRHHDAVLGCFRRAGFPIALTAHAYALLDSYVYGFALQEATLPFDSPAEAAAVATAILEGGADGIYPYLAEFTEQHVTAPGYDFGAEFDVGLDQILEGLAHMLNGGDR